MTHWLPDLVGNAAAPDRTRRRVRILLHPQVHLTAFKARTTPMLDGRVVYVSADSLTDGRTKKPYYDARIEVDRRELERLRHVHLYPGMPVQAMVVTGERTLLEYLVQPLHDSITRAFRED